MTELSINSEYEKLVPSLQAEEYESLKQSLKKEGQIYPIIVSQDGTILDGMTRYRALRELGIEPKTATKIFEDKLDEKRFVLKVNLERRHMNAAQKADLGLKLLELETESARQRQLATLKKGDQLPVSTDSDTRGRAMDIVAQQVGVSRDTLYKAARIQTAIQERPEIKQGWELALEGKASVNGVYTQLQMKSTPDTEDSLSSSILNQEKIAELDKFVTDLLSIDRKLGQHLLDPAKEKEVKDSGVKWPHEGITLEECKQLAQLSDEQFTRLVGRIFIDELWPYIEKAQAADNPASNFTLVESLVANYNAGSICIYLDKANRLEHHKDKIYLCFLPSKRPYHFPATRKLTETEQKQVVQQAVERAEAQGVKA